MKESRNDKVEKVRQGAFEKFVKLTDKALIWIEESLSASKVCNYCDKDGKANKLNAEGKCVVCNGMNKIPDVSQRNWATEQIGDRVAPKPKAVEMNIDTSSDDAFVEDLSKKSDEEVKKLSEELGIKFSGIDE